MNSTEEIEQLKLRIKELEDKLNNRNINDGVREKIEIMSSEVVDSNPYR